MKSFRVFSFFSCLIPLFLFIVVVLGDDTASVTLKVKFDMDYGGLYTDFGSEIQIGTHKDGGPAQGKKLAFLKFHYNLSKNIQIFLHYLYKFF